jgi:uncharacterized protein (TIGR02145 family)/prepilin-type N-terminal cleavage/methylation domain-containing protein
MFKIKKKKRSAFTLIEILVVVAVIGILISIALVYLTANRQSARNARRVADVKQIQTALEAFAYNQGRYPTVTEFSGSISYGDTVYLKEIPVAPTPADGQCSEGDNTYTYSEDGINNGSYILTFCLGDYSGSLSPGLHEATPEGIFASTGGGSSWACGDTLIDSRDSNEYPTVQIGTQCWMAKNLAYLPVVLSSFEFSEQGNNFLPSYGVCDYSGNDVLVAKSRPNYSAYGALYNWFAVNQSGENAICPTGWSAPTDAQLTALTTYLGGESVAGGKMKEAGTTHWDSPNTGATNESGFTALPAGIWFFAVSCEGLGFGTGFWSSSESDSGNSWGRGLGSDYLEIYRNYYKKGDGRSVRCIKD